MNNIKQRQMESELKEIVLKYEDGTEKVVAKGAVISMVENSDNEQVLTFDFAGMAAEDLTAIVTGCINLGYELGMFEGGDEA